MAKVSFTKLGLKVNQDIKTIEYNEQIIEVKQYLPINDKLTLISKVINLSADENNFANPVKADVFFTIEVLDAYTNINFTEKQKEDPCKLYDMLVSSGLFETIKNVIPKDEYDSLYYDTHQCITAVYKYKNSVMGLLETISGDYSNLNLDATNIQKALGDPENMELLKTVLTKLG